MFAVADNLKGNVSVDYRPIVNIDAPQANSFLPGQSIPLPTWWTLDPGSSITPGLTSGGLSIWGQIEFDAYIGGTLCVFSCASATILNIDTPASEFEIIRMPEDGIAQTVGTGIFAFLTGVNASSDNPSVNAIDVTTAGDIALRRLVAQGEDNYASIVFDLDKIATKLGLIPPIGAAVNISSDYNFSADLFDADATINFWAGQTLTFEGQPVITLHFEPAIVGVTGNFLGATINQLGGLDSVTYLVGDEVSAIFPVNLETPVKVTPIVYLENSLTNETDLFTRSDITLKALELIVNLKRFKIVSGSAPVTARVCVDWDWWYPWSCNERRTVTIIPGIPAIYTPSVGIELGPVWNPGSFANQESDHTVLSDGTFSLEGFDTVELDFFYLNPEIPPVADAGGPYFVNEGSTLVLDGSDSFDPDEFDDDYVGSLDYEWSAASDFQDSTLESPVFINIADDLTTTVTLTVSDAWNSDSDTATVTVLNVAPDVANQGAETVDEGSLFTRVIEFTDPGLADTHVVNVDWGDTTSDPALSLTLGTYSFTVSHVYADNGDYTVSVTVLDDDGGSETEQFEITVDNVTPTLSADTDRNVDEGELVEVNLGFSDQGTLDTHTATIKWGDDTSSPAVVTETTSGPPGSTVGMTGTLSDSHVYADDGDYTVKITLADKDGAWTTTSFEVTVNNMVPTVDAGLSREWLLHETAVLDPATFNDPGTLDEHTAIVNWDTGDTEDVMAGIVSENPFGHPGSITGANGTVDASYIYRYPGNYVVTVTVEDDNDDAGIGEDTVSLWVLGAIDLKERAAGFLEPFDDDKKIKDAIRDIGESLESKFWVDLAYLNSRFGQNVFSEEKQAVERLEKALAQKGKKALSSAASDAASAAIELLVQADQILAESQVFMASGLTVWTPKKQKSYDRLMDSAEEAFAKGDVEWSEGDFTKAIDLYRLTWKLASHAEKVATGNLNNFYEGDD